MSGRACALAVVSQFEDDARRHRLLVLAVDVSAMATLSVKLPDSLGIFCAIKSWPPPRPVSSRLAPFEQPNQRLETSFLM